MGIVFCWAAVMVVVVLMVVAVLVVVLVETKGEPPVTTEGFSLRNNIGCLPRYHVVILSM